MSKKQKLYDPEFRRKMFELVRTGRTPGSLAKEFEPTAQAIRNWVKQAELDEALLEQIKYYHQRSRRTYGAPRIQADLREEAGLSVSQKRISRLMAEANIHGVTRRRKIKTTIRDGEARPAPDLVDRNFRAEAPNRLWVADITYVPTQVGFLYLAVVLDVFSRRIVGWHMGNNLRTELVLNALQMAINQRQPEGVVHHSDQGAQYTSLAFGQRCQEAGIRPSMGSVGDCYDNAMCESFFATLECELIDRCRFRDRGHATLEIFDFIEGWYNTHRRHSAIEYLSPINYERRNLQKAA